LVSQRADEIVMEAHRGYYQGTPKIDRLVIRPYSTLRTGWASLMREEIDVLWDVAHDSAEFIASSDVRLHSYSRNYLYLIALKTSHPKFASAPVRRAMNAALDRERLIREVLNGRGLPANGPLWPQHWAYDSTVPGYTYDPSLALTTLDAAGIRRQTDRPRQVPARLSFVCIVPENYAVLERLALAVQKQLYDIGIDMQLQAVSAEDYIQRIQNGNFEAIIGDIISAPVFARPYLFWRSNQALNSFGYSNPLADRWFDSVRYAAGESEYRAATSQLQRTLMENPPALFLAWQERTRAISRRFEVPVEEGRDPIPLLWQWTPRSARDVETH
jgi:peptide/nickel transport system substrate-binding protein